MDGPGFNEGEFYRLQREADRKWTVPVNLAVGLHVGVVFAALYLPAIFDHKPLLDEVITVNLVSLETVEATPEVTPQLEKPVPETTPPKPAPTVKPEVKKVPVIPKPEPEITPASVEPARPISVKPLKRKIRKARDTRLAEEKQRQRRAEELKRQDQARKRDLARARQLEKQAAEEARRATAELASVYRETQAVQSAPRRPSGSSSGSKQVKSAMLRQYYADLQGRVQQRWKPPEMKKWPPTLETRIEFTVRKDGSVTNLVVAKKSGDAFFDRFAKEAVRSAAPMPPIPGVLKETTVDIGLRFLPTGVQR
ncbi:MAG: TonB family protein [Desulfobulbaceae bacterium]|nr:TonB family protein [Desulfobulbaceae bacterium]